MAEPRGLAGPSRESPAAARPAVELPLGETAPTGGRLLGAIPGAAMPGAAIPGAATPAIASATATDADPEAIREAAQDARLIRAVRWRLVAWSGGLTLLVLLVLGVALYAAAASTLESSGLSLLQNRVDDWRQYLTGSQADTDRSPADFVFGGGGTIAYGFTADGRIVRPPGGNLSVVGVVDMTAAQASDASGRDVRFRTINVQGPIGTAQVAVPVRQLTVPIETAAGRIYVQALQDRTSEISTLQTLVVVLVVGGVIVVLVAVGFGAFYARRALTPIRDSLAGQRAALRRQREFAADASHELRTPLTVIRSSVEHLRRHADEPVAVVGDALEDIDAEVSQLTSMVEDLLLLARSDSGAVSLEQRPVELDDVAADAASGLRGPAEASGIRLVVDPEPAPVVGDPTRLRQLVTVLIDNAIHHSPPGGEVRVSIRRLEDRVHLTVEDEGRGIRDEDLPRVFDRFWRAPDAPSGGTGLGLAIAKWIAESHGGAITAGNRGEGGARFDVELPARSTAYQPPPEATSAPPPATSAHSEPSGPSSPEEPTDPSPAA